MAEPEYKPALIKMIKAIHLVYSGVELQPSPPWLLRNFPTFHSAAWITDSFVLTFLFGLTPKFDYSYSPAQPYPYRQCRFQ